MTKIRSWEISAVVGNFYEEGNFRPPPPSALLPLSPSITTAQRHGMHTMALSSLGVKTVALYNSIVLYCRPYKTPLDSGQLIRCTCLSVCSNSAYLPCAPTSAV